MSCASLVAVKNALKQTSVTHFVLRLWLAPADWMTSLINMPPSCSHGRRGAAFKNKGPTGYGLSPAAGRATR